MPYDVILYFRLPYFHVSNNALFLRCDSVLSFYIDVILTLAIIRHSVDRRGDSVQIEYMSVSNSIMKRGAWDYYLQTK